MWLMQPLLWHTRRDVPVLLVHEQHVSVPCNYDHHIIRLSASSKDYYNDAYGNRWNDSGKFLAPYNDFLWYTN